MRQLLFYVSFLTATLAYDSSMLEQPRSQRIKTVFQGELSELRLAEPPREIEYVHADNVRLYGKMAVPGILFTYREPAARMVQFFNGNRFSRHSMERSRHGVWFYVYVPQGNETGDLRYKYIADGFFVADPANTLQKEDGARGMFSLFMFDDESIRPAAGVVLAKKSRGTHSREVLFRFYLPEASRVEIAGTFNHWNGNMDIMREKGNGLYELRKSLPPGEHHYILRVDGVPLAVPDMKEYVRHPVYGRVGLLKVP